MSFVGADNSLNQFMANDIHFVELGEKNTFRTIQGLHRFHQSGLPIVGKIDLGGIAGDHAFGALAESGQEWAGSDHSPG